MTTMQFAQSATLLAATLTTGLTAGLFYAFDYAVMRGLRRTDDQTFVWAMRAINIAILNGWFALIFGGALLFTAVTAALHLSGDRTPALPWVLAAGACYLTTVLVTGRVHVRLNVALHRAGTAPDEDVHAARTAFEVPWNRWNRLRTSFNTLAFGLLIAAWLAQSG